MSKYFSEFPSTQYRFSNSSFAIEKTVTDVTLKTQILDTIDQDDPYLFLPYTIREGERAEEVSNFYYGTTDLVWLVYFSNDIIDPYESWPMDQRQFHKFFSKKYETESGSDDAIDWGRNTLISDNIIHYKNTSNSSITITKDTYDLGSTFNSDFNAIEWEAVRFYDYESEINESNRNIKLLNESYAITAEANLTRLMNG